MKKARLPLSFLCLWGIPMNMQAQDYTNSIGMIFTLIPAGSFMMGEDPSLNNEGKDDERPQHEVTISKPFYVGIYEVTQKQWEDVMGQNPSYHKGDNNPVDSVSWNDVQEFIQKLNAREEHNRYRLPTEAEWEYAARGGTKTRYFWGNEQSKLIEHAWVVANAKETTHPVGTKKPNAFGIYDTSGNVREWVNDWYDRDYYSKSAKIDPKGPASGYGRAYRGGSKDGAEFPTRSSYRWRETPDTKVQNLGFRLVMEVED
ncbi:MAG: formylglycine-generating enzyme family protein [Helicobacter sp.]|nr:formylglycine-generating enzyme family protein [Helicobacter sp.]